MSVVRYNFIFFLLLIFLPGTVDYVFNFGSYSPGIMLAISCIFFIFLFLRRGKGLFTCSSTFFSVLLISFLLIASLPFYFCIDYFAEYPGFHFDYKKYILSIVFFIVVLFFSAHKSSVDLQECDLRFDATICSIGLLLGAYGFLSSAFVYFIGGSDKNMFFYSEPSHYALVMGPFLLYQLKKGGLYYFYIPFLLLAAFLIQNLTLIIVVLLAIVFSMYKKIRFENLTAVFFFVLLLTSLLYSNNYFSDRIRLTSSSNNSSVLTLLSGYEIAFLSLKNTFGLGYGFQQMGQVSERGMLIDRIIEVRGGHETTSNINDGGTFFSKIIVEFGFWGLLIVFSYLCLFFVVLLKSSYKNIGRLSFYESVILMSFMYVFFRGSGYFMVSFILLIYSVIGYFNINSTDLCTGPVYGTKLLQVKHFRGSEGMS